MDNNKEIQISKKLSYHLRHNLHNFTADSAGFVPVAELLRPNILGNCSVVEIKQIVQNNDKQRFALENRNGNYYIRANQGHSQNSGQLIDNKQMFTKIELPLPFIAHGTKSEYLSSILKNGLKRQSRQHIHLVDNLNQNQVISGFKKQSDQIIVIDMTKCMNDGMTFYRSNNNVILTEGLNGVIDPKYFTQIKSI